MSLLVCSICEENREPIQRELKKVKEKLGASAQGYSPFLAGLECPHCSSKKKDFNLQSFQLWRNCEFNFSVLITCNEKGEYFVGIHDREKLPSFIDTVEIINAAIQWIKNLEDTSSNQYHLPSIRCQCGEFFVCDEDWGDQIY